MNTCSEWKPRIALAAALTLATLLPAGDATAQAAQGSVKDAGFSVPDAKTFAEPPVQFRPMQIVHGFDRNMTSPKDLTGEEGIDAFLDQLRAMGVGGVVANISFKDYLQSPRQWEIWNHGAAKTVEKGMTLWIYDEMYYPSGTAGGVVTRAHPEYLALGMAYYMYTVKAGESVLIELPVSSKACEGAVAFQGNGQPIDLRAHVDEWGTLRWTAPAQQGGADSEWTICYFARRNMFEGTFVTTEPYGTTHHYIDVLNPDAVKAFIRVTHQAYRNKTPQHVWKHIDAVFTDEPVMLAAYVGSLPAERDSKQPILDQPFFTDRPPALPWTTGFAEKFQASKGYDIRPHLRSLFTGNSRQDRYVRQHYREVSTKLYTEAYHQQIADWCAANHIASSGHVLAEEGLHGTITFEGSLMAVTRPMQLPGIDMLECDPNDVLTEGLLAPKVVSSVAHLTGRDAVQCEASEHNNRGKGEKMGVPEMRGQANILYAMGVNHLTLYHHWSRVGQEGYRAYNDYVARLGAMLRGGNHVCDVAVVYPIRSAWSWYAPWGKKGEPSLPTGDLSTRIKQVETRFHNTCLTLAQNQIDFDTIDEQAIQEAAMNEGAMRIAAEKYRVIVLAGVEALELKTLRALEKFQAAGGVLLRVDGTPELADSEANQAEFDAAVGRMFASGAPLELAGLTGEIRSRIGADLKLEKADDRVCYTHRVHDGRDIYFVVNNRNEANTVTPKLKAKGPWKLYRPMTGKIDPAPADLSLTLEPYEGVFLVN